MKEDVANQINKESTIDHGTTFEALDDSLKLLIEVYKGNPTITHDHDYLLALVESVHSSPYDMYELAALIENILNYLFQYVASLRLG